MTDLDQATALVAAIALVGVAAFIVLLCRRDWTWLGLFTAVGCLLASIAHFQILVQMIFLTDYADDPNNIGLIIWYYGLGWGLLLLFISALLFGAMIAAMMPPRIWAAPVMCFASIYILWAMGTWVFEQWISIGKLPSMSIGVDWPLWIGFPAFLFLIFGPFLSAIPWSLSRPSRSAGNAVDAILRRYWVMLGAPLILLSVLLATMLSSVGWETAVPDDPESRSKLALVAAMALVSTATMLIMFLIYRTFLIPAISIIEGIKTDRAISETVQQNSIWQPVARSLEATKAELWETKALFEAFIQHAPNPMVLMDTKGQYVMINDATAANFGKTPAEMLTMSAQEIAARFPDAETVNYPMLERVMTNLKMEWVDLKFEMPSGELRDYAFSFFPILGADGQLAYIGNISHDITEERRARVALMESRDALHQSEKLAALGSMLAGVSHELNNPLAAVIGQTALLAEDLEGTVNADRVSKIRRAADRCARIVQSFLAMARQKAPEYRLVNINDQVRSAVELTEYQMRAAQVTLDLKLAENLPKIEADPDELHQVIANLLTNARQALEEVSGERRITVTTSRAGRMIQLSVADTGNGIDAATRDRIFDPFFTTKAVGAGTGIGLSYSLGIIEALGGSIAIKDADFGTVFVIRLPMQEDAAETTAAEAMPEERAKGRVLVIDDEEDVADTLSDLLSRQGLDVTVAIGGVAGLAAMAQGAQFDLILSDIRMPDLDGPTLYAWMTANRADLLDCIAFVTGDTMSGHAADFIAKAGCPVLEKPFTPAALRTLVAVMTELSDGEIA